MVGMKKRCQGIAVSTTVRQKSTKNCRKVSFESSGNVWVGVPVTLAHDSNVFDSLPFCVCMIVPRSLLSLSPNLDRFSGEGYLHGISGGDDPWFRVARWKET